MEKAAKYEIDNINPSDIDQILAIENVSFKLPKM